MASNRRYASAGLDVGTSGCRAAVVDHQGGVLSRARAEWPDGVMPADPETWWVVARSALARAVAETRRPVGRVAVDGTSGTVVWTATDGTPLTRAMRYNEPAAGTWAAVVAHQAPATSGAHGSSSGLARALHLAALYGLRGPCQLLTQTDWIAGRLCGRFDCTDENNALKLGYDPVSRCWPDWLQRVPLPDDCLPAAFEPGTAIGTIRAEVARATYLRDDCQIVAGTTDSIAGFLATGARVGGEAVTSLGTTLALKQVSRQPVFAPEHGVYSHRLGDQFLAGGASNCGAGILTRYFSQAELEALSARLDPDHDTGLDYYPLPAVGERFPYADPQLQPRLEPRPEDPVRFLQGLMEGVAAVEAEGYRRLQELGAPALERVITVGGGAANPAWTRIRSRYLGVPVSAAEEAEAAVGAARLAGGLIDT
ncbi:FGGY-family carbohydrate kinase [Halorhodospira sp. 9622]|uniref:FGGY-family carbohydrate kinase n=1 Tax=Halorhodospira sp. 9622 TaxID=2899136 RepID=UPI001EE873A0|nr:FGGY-family carbohydrate kinase [Halorhodospira sp. 9622]